MVKSLISLFLGLILVAPVAAQTTDEQIRQRIQDRGEDLRERTQDVREEFRTRSGEIREEFRTRTDEARERVRVEVRTLRGEVRERFEERRREAEEEVERRREEFRARFEEKREEAKTRIEARRAELKEELERIRSERKKEIVERIYERVNALNERITEHFLQVLDKLELILDNVAERTDKAEAHGLDVSAVRVAITDAHSAIAASRAAVEEQAGKVYAPEITTEEDLREDVGEIRQMLHNDLVAVRETVRAAHDAVRNAAVTLAQIPRVDELEVELEEPAEETE